MALGFGDRDAFAFEIHPRFPTWDRRSASDRGPWAELRVWCRGRCLTSGVIPGEGRAFEGVEVPLLPFATWLVEHSREIAHEEFPSSFREDGAPHDVLRLWNEQEPRDEGASERLEEDRYLWYGRHFWMAGAEGCMVPDLAFARIDGDLYYYSRKSSRAARTFAG
ncbi:MAG: hypothetical protein HY719_00445 [Planctomycetes bacterium]|nr:hypothetical protein [Planctomycetota bacterium]